VFEDPRRTTMRGSQARVRRRAIVAKTPAAAAVFLAHVEIRSPAVQTPAIKHCKPAKRWAALLIPGRIFHALVVARRDIRVSARAFRACLWRRTVAWPDPRLRPGHARKSHCLFHPRSIGTRQGATDARRGAGEAYRRGARDWQRQSARDREPRRRRSL